jgi:hypothetical protein
MAEDNQLVLVAAYQDDQLAQQEFDALVGLVKAKTVRADGAILVAKDADGTVRLSDTGKHLGRKGAGWGGGGRGAGRAGPCSQRLLVKVRPEGVGKSCVCGPVGCLLRR